MVSAILQLAARRPHRGGRGRGDRGAARVPRREGCPLAQGFLRYAGAARRRDPPYLDGMKTSRRSSWPRWCWLPVGEDEETLASSQPKFADLTVTVDGGDAKTAATRRATPGAPGGRRHRPEDVRARPGDQACTRQYGGPGDRDRAGGDQRQGLDAKFSRENGCEIARWEAAKPCSRRWSSRWRVTVRTGPKAEKERYDAVEAALDAVEMYTRATANTERRGTSTCASAGCDAGDQVAPRGAGAARRSPPAWTARRRRGGADRRRAGLAIEDDI